MSQSVKTNLELVLACDAFPYEDDPEVYRLFLPRDSRPHGLLRGDIVKRMPWTSSFVIDHVRKSIHLHCDCSDGALVECVNNSFAEVITNAIETNEFEMINGRHSEFYLIPGANHFCQLERFTQALFGTVARGAHLTAYTYTKNGELKIWVPRRAADLYTYPNKLDSSVAGGVKASDTPRECIIAEAQEEASLQEPFVEEQVRAVGTLTYVSLVDSRDKREQELISPEILYLYDLEVPEGMTLQPHDGEVKQFYLMSVEEVQIALKASEFKTNSAVVMLDFFVRHGIITSENEPHYVEIISRMHRRLPVAFAP